MLSTREKLSSDLLSREMNHWDAAQRSGRYFACGRDFAKAHQRCIADRDGQDKTLVSIGLKSGMFRGQKVTAFFDFRRKARKSWKVLEIGAGYGGYAPIIAPHVKAYVGTDISPYVVNEGSKGFIQAGIKNASLVCTPDSDLISALEPGVQFDFIFASGVFIHLPRDLTKGYISQSAFLLKPDGVFLFHFNVLEDPDAQDHFETAYGTKNSHRMRYGKASYLSLFDETGLEVRQEIEIPVGEKGFHAHYAYGGLESVIDEKTIVEDSDPFVREPAMGINGFQAEDDE